MAARGHYPSAFEGHSIQPPGMMRHGPFPGMDPDGHRSLEHISEAERLTRENQRLAATQVDLRRELVAAQQEVQRLKAHIGSTQTESDIQIRILLEKIAKMEADIRAGEGLRKDVQQVHMEAQSLVTIRQELSTQIQQSTLELQKAQAEVKILPELLNELNSLRQEHQKLRSTFEYEKDVNTEQVEQMRAMEKNLVFMAREVEKLRSEVLTAEKNIHAPNPYMSSYASYPPPPVQAGDVYGRPQLPVVSGAAGDGMNLYGSGGGGWGGSYDVTIPVPPSHVQT